METRGIAARDAPRKVPQEIRRLHRTLSPEAAGMLELAAASGSLAGRDHRSGRSDWVRGYPYPRQLLPTILADRKLTTVRTATTELARIIKESPFTIFDGDPVRIAEFYGIEVPDWVELVLSEPNGLPGALSRGDFIDSETGFRCVEYNMSACLGGWQIRYFADELRSSPWVVEALERGGRSAAYVDPVRVLFAHVIDESLAARARQSVNAMLLLGESYRKLPVPMPFDSLYAAYDELVDADYSGLSGRLFVGAFDELTPDGGGFTFGGEPVDAIVEYSHMPSNAHLLRAMKVGAVQLYNGPVSRLIQDKRILALLSDPRTSHRLSPKDRELVERHVPWTRTTDLRETEFRGQRVLFPEFLLEARELLVLKPAMGGRGKSVFVGRETDPDEWAGVVAEAQGSRDWIVQEYLSSKPYWYVSQEGELLSHTVVWGLFAFGERYGGGFLRMMPAGRGSVVNSALGATEGLILEIEGAD